MALPPHKKDLLIIFSLTAVMTVLVFAHVNGINGPIYWVWEWRRLDPLRIFGGTIIGLLPLLAAGWGLARNKIRPFTALLITAVSMWLLMMLYTGFQRDPFSLRILSDAIQSPRMTGFFSNALQHLDNSDFLRSFETLMPGFHRHAHIKPPGLILFNMAMLNLIPSAETAAFTSAIIISAVAALAVFAVYALLRVFGLDAAGAFAGSACFALLSGPILFTPLFDQCYPVLSCGMIALWIRALDSDRERWSVATGLMLFAASFIVYNILVVGFFMAGYLMYILITKRGSGIIQIARHAVIALSTAALCYLVLWRLTGFKPLAAFRMALHLQSLIEVQLTYRPYPITIPFDLLDFFLGCNWIIPALAIIGFIRLFPGKGGTAGREFWISALCLAQILIVAVTGILIGETARVWIFLMPLILYPAAHELNSWAFPYKLLFWSMLWFLTCVICLNMTFI